MRAIPLTQGKVALVDDADYDWLMQWNWYALKQRRKAGEVYYAVRAAYNPKRLLYMHRVLLGLTGALEADHRDNDGLNNQRFNLRPSTPSQNCANRMKLPHRMFKGVHWEPDRRKWRAVIKVGGKVYRLGRFSDAASAADAYANAARKFFGEFAKL